MEIRKDFADRVGALSSSTPREAIANLLSALMPRVAAKTRAPVHPDDKGVMLRDRPQDLNKEARRLGVEGGMYKGAPDGNFVNWAEPIEAVHKETGRRVPMEDVGTDGSGYRRTRSSPDKNTSNELWQEDGADLCSQDAWYVQNVVPIKKDWLGGGGMRKLQGEKTPKTGRPLPTGLLSYVAPNPKKRGSASFKRYTLYADCIGKGAAAIVASTDITAADILWDVEHNFIRFN